MFLLMSVENRAYWQNNHCNYTAWTTSEFLGVLFFRNKESYSETAHGIPIGSMYGIFTYMLVISGVNAGKYSIHGAFWIGYVGYQLAESSLPKTKKGHHWIGVCWGKLTGNPHDFHGKIREHSCDLTAISLGIMVSKENHPLFMAPEFSLVKEYLYWFNFPRKLMGFR